jgi:hypothetical protein
MTKDLRGLRRFFMRHKLWLDCICVAGGQHRGNELTTVVGDQVAVRFGNFLDQAMCAKQAYTSA